MTTSADFTDSEWETVLEGPTSAGMMIIAADRGATIRETFSMAKAYTEARQRHGASELTAAVDLVEAKASSEELADYKAFIVSLAQHVAEVKGVSGKERAAIEEIATAIGAEAPPSSDGS